MKVNTIETFRDLDAWKVAMDLAEASYRFTRSFPREETFGLTSQIRRAATSIPANIAEGFGRETRAEFVRGLRIAQGSLKELETHVEISHRVGLASAGSEQEVQELADRAGRLLRALIRSLNGPRPREGY